MASSGESTNSFFILCMTYRRENLSQQNLKIVVGKVENMPTKITSFDCEKFNEFSVSIVSEDLSLASSEP